MEHERATGCVPGLTHVLAAHDPEDPSQSASVLQWALTQCLPGPAPAVHDERPVVLCATRFEPETMKKLVAPSGMSDGGTVVALPPPM